MSTRLQVRSIDAAKRTWGDKDACKSTLKALAEKDKLEYIEESDTVKFQLPSAILTCTECYCSVTVRHPAAV